MFLGEFQHSIDDKGRIKLPAKLKDAFDDGAVITERLDGSLGLYPLAAFEEIARRFAEMDEFDPNQRKMREDVGSSSEVVTMDKGGRIVIPSRMRDITGIENDVYINGNFTYLTIWPKESWEERRKENRETREVRARNMAQKK